jgi:TolB-like protein/Tfp pilus assembly protein PilF
VARRTSIAVLPFANLTADAENAYFADGIAEDLLTELSKIAAFRVVSRTSSMQIRTRDRSVRDIARMLHANVVIEGSVRRACDRVRIAVRAVNADTDEQVWADTYDRRLEDIFAIQREVALQVASALAPGLSSAERALVGHPGTPDVEAYQLYLQGRHCLNRATEEGVHQAIEYFERAAVRDSSYAQPHSGIGFAYMFLGMGHGAGRIPQREAQARARKAIDRALAIDPLLVDARGVEACLKFMFEFDWEGAERAFRSAIQLAPDNAMTHAEYGLYLSSLERYDDALVEQRQAHDLDPLHPIFMSDIASTLLRAGRYDEALAQARALIALEPTFPMAHSTMGWAYVRKRQFEEGLHELNEAVSISPGNSLFLAQLGQAYAESGRADRAREVLEYLTDLGRERYVSPYHLAYVHTGLGDHEKAIDCLEQAVEERAGSVYGIRGSFLFRELRGHPRFVAILRRMNLA